MHNYLKVKVLSLGAEAKIIRNEEMIRRRLIEAAFVSNHPESAAYHEKVRAGHQAHRCFDVRRESRSAGLAYGFCRGRAYQEMEHRAKTPPNWEKIERLVYRYSEIPWPERKAKWEAWLKVAKNDYWLALMQMEKERAERKLKKELKAKNELLDSV